MAAAFTVLIVNLIGTPRTRCPVYIGRVHSALVTVLIVAWDGASRRAVPPLKFIERRRSRGRLARKARQVLMTGTDLAQ